MTDEEVLAKHSACSRQFCSVEAPTKEGGALGLECKRADALKAQAVTELTDALKRSFSTPTKRAKGKR